MINFPVVVDEFDTYYQRVYGMVAKIDTEEEYAEARQKYIGDSYTFYDATGKVLFN